MFTHLIVTNSLMKIIPVIYFQREIRLFLWSFCVLDSVLFYFILFYSVLKVKFILLWEDLVSPFKALRLLHSIFDLGPTHQQEEPPVLAQCQDVVPAQKEQLPERSFRVVSIRGALPGLFSGIHHVLPWQLALKLKNVHSSLTMNEIQDKNTFFPL